MSQSTLIVLVTQLCPIICDPMNCSLSGSSAHGILQARILEWVAISSRVVQSPRILLGWMYLLAFRHISAVIGHVKHDHKDRRKDSPTGILWVRKERSIETSQKELKCSRRPAATILLRQQARPSAFCLQWQPIALTQRHLAVGTAGHKN